MKPFMDKDFLLDTEAAKVLYHEYAEKMPIIDYHCHIDPMEIAEDVRWDNITQVWLGGRTPSGGYFGDHYKWRLMRSAGVPEKYITGDADPEDKFVAWAGALQGAIGNPLYHWTHLELQRYFDIHAPLTRENASQVYQACNRRLQEGDLSVRGILRQSRVKLLCTTDDPADDLKAHERIAADKNCPTIVLPAFRPDKAMRVDKPAFAPYIRRLEQVVGFSINTMEDLRWLRESGMEAKILKHANGGGAVLGICGGYQMLGAEVRDPEGVEGGGRLRGLGLLPHSTVFLGEKTRTQVEGRFREATGIFAGLRGVPFEGYEIHMGATEQVSPPVLSMEDQTGREKTDGQCRGNVLGCYVHGLFDRGETAAALVNCLLEARGLTPEAAALDREDYARQQYDKLAQGLRAALDMDAIYRILNGED